MSQPIEASTLPPTGQQQVVKKGAVQLTTQEISIPSTSQHTTPARPMEIESTAEANISSQQIQVSQKTTFLGLALYNNAPENGEIVKVGMYEGMLAQRKKLIAIQRKPYPVRLHTKSITPQAWKFTLWPQPAISGGQLTIESPDRLNKRIFSVQLPIDKQLENGLKITLFAPQTGPSRIEYYAPTGHSLPRLTITASIEKPETPQLIIVKIGTKAPAVITSITEAAMPGSLLYQTRVLIDHAFQTMHLPTRAPLPFELPTDENTIIHTNTIPTSTSSHSIEKLLEQLGEGSSNKKSES